MKPGKMKAVVLFVILVSVAAVIHFRHRAQIMDARSGAAVNEAYPLRSPGDVKGRRLTGSYLFTDQDGNPFDLEQWFDKPFIVSYIYTQCPDMCPTITANLAKVVDKRKALLGRDFRVITIGFDKEHDTPGAMREFGSHFVDNFDNWKFVVGDPAMVKSLGEKLGITYGKDKKGNWMHTMGITLVAPGGVVYRKIRGVEYTESQVFLPLENSLNRRAP